MGKSGAAYLITHKATGAQEIKTNILATKETESRFELIDRISRGRPVSSINYHKSLFDIEQIR